jgi:hypothetical protein
VGLASLAEDSETDVPGGSQMVVHPALYGLPVGDAAVMADAIGFAMSEAAFRSKLEAAGVESSLVQKAVTWRDTPSGWYKIIDAPLEIVLRDGLVRAERTEVGGYPLSLREVGFLAFQALEHGKPEPETRTPFYEALPALVTTFPAFERLNSFAEAFALARWSKLSGAEIILPPSPKAGQAHLIILRLHSGELLQTTAEEAPSAAAADLLDHVGDATNTALSTLRSANAPEGALRKVGELSVALQDTVRIDVAINEIDRAPHQDKQEQDQRDALIGQLRDKLKQTYYTIHQFSSKQDAIQTFADPTTAAHIVELQQNIDQADRNLSDSRQALEDVESLDKRVASLRADKRRAVDPLYTKWRDAEAKLDDNDSLDDAEEVDQKAAERAQAELERALPPVDANLVATSRNSITSREAEVEKAMNELEEAFSAATPAWLDNSWPTIRRLQSVLFHRDSEDDTFDDDETSH